MKPNLKELSRNGAAQFELDLKGVPTLRCLEIVRCIPDKRLVCRANWDGQSVYAKLFIGKEAKRYAKRDLRGIKALVDADIATPDLLYAGEITDSDGEALVFAEVADSQNAEQAMDSLSTRETRFLLAKSLVTEVARHHQAGLIQTDVYLKNFLLQGTKIYTLDGDAICTMRAFLRRCQALGNLALLLSKFDVVDEMAWLPELLQAYAQERGWDSAISPVCMHKRIAAHRRKVIRGYADKKVFRQCSDVEVEKDFDYFLAIARPYFSESLRAALSDPDKLLDEPAQRLKSGNTCTVSLTQAGGRKAAVKRYNIKSFWHGLNRALRPTRAAVSWANAHRLRMYGIATAAPIALLEKRCGIIRRQAYFVAEYIDAPDAAEFFADAKVSAVQKNKMAERIAQLFHKLYLLKIAHGDFKGGNMKIVAGEPVLLDLDSMCEYRCDWLFIRRHVRDLRRFMRNWEHDSELSKKLAAAFRAIYKNTRLLDKVGMATTQNGAA